MEKFIGKMEDFKMFKRKLSGWRICLMYILSWKKRNKKWK